MRTTPICVIVRFLKHNSNRGLSRRRQLRGFDADHLIPVSLGTFAMRRKHDGLKVTTVTRMATLGRQAMTKVTVMATPRGPIPVIIGAVEACRAYQWGGWLKNARRQSTEGDGFRSQKGSRKNPRGIW